MSKKSIIICDIIDFLTVGEHVKDSMKKEKQLKVIGLFYR